MKNKDKKKKLTKEEMEERKKEFEEYTQKIIKEAAQKGALKVQVKEEPKRTYQDFVNEKAFQGTLLAHTDGQVPNLLINIPTLDEYNFGYLVYFFEKACGISGYLLGVNPFNQPGVEAYKKNMFALLGKPGFEKEKEELEKRL